jgi:hypothetical protein
MGKPKYEKKGIQELEEHYLSPLFLLLPIKKTFVNLFERTLKRHNIKMKSYVAVQKKLLTKITTPLT